MVHISNVFINKDNLKLGVEIALYEKNILLDLETYNKTKEQCLERTKLSIESNDPIGVCIQLKKYDTLECGIGVYGVDYDDNTNFIELLRSFYPEERGLIINTDLIDVSIKPFFKVGEKTADCIVINMEVIRLFQINPLSKIKKK